MNEEEMKMTIWLQQKTIEAKNMTIECLERRVTELESGESPLLKSKEELIKSKDERIAFLEGWLKDKDQEIERLRLQVQTNEFNRLFVFGKVGMGKA